MKFNRLILINSNYFQGDSGSPIVQYMGGRAVMVGVLSTMSKGIGNGCVTPKGKTAVVHAIRVSSVIDWIINTTKGYNQG